MSAAMTTARASQGRTTDHERSWPGLAVNGVKTFSASKSGDRNDLGDEVTDWLRENPELEITDIIVSQSSDGAFHCLSITVLYFEADLPAPGSRGKRYLIGIGANSSLARLIDLTFIKLEVVCTADILKSVRTAAIDVNGYELFSLSPSAPPDTDGLPVAPFPRSCHLKSHNMPGAGWCSALAVIVFCSQITARTTDHRSVWWDGNMRHRPVAPAIQSSASWSLASWWVANTRQ